MPLYTRTDLVDAFNNNYDSTAIDNIIANLDELATYESGYTTDSSSEIVTVDATDTQYFRLLVDMDDSTSVIICDNIDELNFRTYKGVCQIGSEQIYFGSVNDVYDTTSIMLYDCVRGYNATTPAEHLTDATGEILYYIADIEYQVWYEDITPADETAVLNWKILYYEDVYNQAIRSNNGIVIRDSLGPYYPLRDYRVLLDEFDDTYLNFGDGTASFEFTTDGTSIIEAELDNNYKYIEYEYDAQKILAGISYQLSFNDVPYPYDTTSDVIFGVYGQQFVGLSEDGINWVYNYYDSTAEDIFETTDIDVAKNNPLTLYGTLIPGIDFEISSYAFFKPRKVKFVRFYFRGLSYSDEVEFELIPPYGYSYSHKYKYYDLISIAKLTYEEIVQGYRIRNVTVPATSKLTDATIGARVSGSIVSSGGASSTSWTTVGSSTSTVSGVDSIMNEECRVERGSETGTIYFRIYDNINADVIDSVTLTSSSNVSAQLFNRNLALDNGETVSRQIQVKVSSGANISYAIRYQNTRHGFS